MKNIILLCLLAYTHLSFAQNWMPFRVGETYNYTNSTPDVVYPGVDLQNINCNTICFANPPMNNIPNVNINMYHNNELQIWIDSIIRINLDSIYYFNKKVLPYNLAGQPAISTNNDLGFGVLNNTFVKNSLGQYIFHYNVSDSLMFDTTWVLNHSAVSDFSTMLTAKLVSVDFDTLPNYNTFDSIKTINYYDNNNILKYQIVFTKNHGINSFQDISTNTNHIQQVGIESENLGTNQLTIPRIFDFNIGDKFYYQEYEVAYPGIFYTIYEVEILSKNIISPDSIVYDSRKTGWQQVAHPSFNGVNILNSTQLISVTPNNVFRDGYYWIGSEVNLKDNEGLYNPWFGAYNGYSALHSKNFLTDGDLEYKYLSYDFGWNALPSPYFISDTSINPYIYTHDTLAMTGTKQLYAKGLGIVHKKEFAIDYDFCQTLIGYIKNNDTVGIVIPNHILLGIENPLTNPEQPQITIYPNPANENLVLKLDKLPLAKYLQIEIIDLHGRVLLSQQKTPENSYAIPLENFSNGLYLLQLKDEKGRMLGLEKFVIRQ